MHRTTIMLPEDLKRRAQRAAFARDISLAELIREALEAQLASQPDPRARFDWSKDSFFGDKAVWDGDGPADLAENHDKYLYDDEDL